MKTIRKINVFLTLALILLNFIFVSPSYSLVSREELFKNALNLSSRGNFELALKEWDYYLELYPNDSAALSNRGNVKLVTGDIQGSIKDQDEAINLDPIEVDPYINRGYCRRSIRSVVACKKRLCICDCKR